MTTSQPHPQVTLYVVPNCPLCERARSWLRRHEVEYVERDVAMDFSALRSMYELTRQKYVPVFEVDGQAAVRPNDSELAALLLNRAR